jgi:NAD-dependent dihydropyrimidine dehydrogenase PreA subunit
MSYVITEPCIGSKDASCVEVCPVDCIHPTPDEPGFADAEQLFIDATECIECDACVNQCPVEAIYPGDLVPESMNAYVAKSETYFDEMR